VGRWKEIEKLAGGTMGGKRKTTKALFSSKFFCKIGIITLLFVFEKYCPIMD
jgi:hypothetical protein